MSDNAEAKRASVETISPLTITPLGSDTAMPAFQIQGISPALAVNDVVAYLGFDRRYLLVLGRAV